MLPQRYPAPDISPTAAAGTLPPPRRNPGYVIATGVLLVGMFSVASANRSRPADKAPDPVIAAQEKAIKGEDDDLALSALQQLRSGDPENALYSYMIAGHYARRQEWQPAVAALDRGNAAARLTLAESATTAGSYPALPVLRQLVVRCTEEATRRSDDTGEALLRASGMLASRMARDATPCDLSVLQNAGSAWQTVERARIAVWERDERFADADDARARLAARKKWWQEVNRHRTHADTADTAVREKLALRLRKELMENDRWLVASGR